MKTNKYNLYTFGFLALINLVLVYILKIYSIFIYYLNIK